MIPASYLFSQAYRQAWHEPTQTEIVTKEEARNPGGGLFSPLIELFRRVPLAFYRPGHPDLKASL